MQLIYAHAVETGTGTFEIEPPSLEEMTRRWSNVVDRGWPFMVASPPDDVSRVLAFAYAVQYRDRAAYEKTFEVSVYTAHTSARMGAGSVALAEVLTSLRADGAREALAFIGDSYNAASIGLHRKLGFQHVGTLKNVGEKFGRKLAVAGPLDFVVGHVYRDAMTRAGYRPEQLLDHMVCVDGYVNETTRHAHVILPPCSALQRPHYDLALHIFAVRNTAKFSLPLFGIYDDFPAYSARTGGPISIEDRINNCMTRSMNGRALPNDAPEMRAMVAYVEFLGSGVPRGQDVPGLGTGKMKVFAQMMKDDGSSGYSSVLLVRRESPINSAEDLFKQPGAYKLGYGDPHSTSGYLVPNIFLFKKANIDPVKHFKSVVNQAPRANFLAVANKEVDVAVNNTEDLELFKKELPDKFKDVRVIWTSQTMPDHPILISRDLPEVTRTKIEQFFIAYGADKSNKSHAATLKNIRGLSGFRKADNTQLKAVSILEMHNEVGKVESNTALSADEKKKRLAEISTRMQKLNALIASPQ